MHTCAKCIVSTSTQPWLGPPPNLFSTNIFKCLVWNQTTKFNDRQYFLLYSICSLLYSLHITRIMPQAMQHALKYGILHFSVSLVTTCDSCVELSHQLSASYSWIHYFSDGITSMPLPTNNGNPRPSLLEQRLSALDTLPFTH